MKIQYDVIEYHIDDALHEFKKVYRLAKKGDLEEGDIFPLMQHALEMLNFGFNARFMNREVISKISQEDFEKYLSPPKEFFSCVKKNEREMKIQNETVRFFMEKAFAMLKIILKGCKNRTLSEAEVYFFMEDAMKTLNFAFNTRFLSLKNVMCLTNKDREKYFLPPRKIFDEWKGI